MFSLITKRQTPNILRTTLTKQKPQASSFSIYHRMSASNTNEYGQGASHAGHSNVPEGIQKAAPKGVEDSLPDSVHDTGSNKDTGKVSHATGDSKVPQALQEALPESVERAVPDAIHDTSGLPPKGT